MPAPKCAVALLNVGKPRLLPDALGGGTFTSSIARQSVDGPVRVRLEGIEGDACAASVHHGEYMRVNAFCEAHYPDVEAFAGKALPRPAFGENLTLRGIRDNDIRVGDVVSFPGGAVLKVTQPREPCSNVPRYLGVPGILKWLVNVPVTGFYFGVVEVGEISPGDALKFEHRGPAQWTIERINRLTYHEMENEALVHRLLDVEELSPRWKEMLQTLLDRQRARRMRAEAVKGD